MCALSAQLGECRTAGACVALSPAICQPMSRIERARGPGRGPSARSGQPMAQAPHRLRSRPAPLERLLGLVRPWRQRPGWLTRCVPTVAACARGAPRRWPATSRPWSAPATARSRPALPQPGESLSPADCSRDHVYPLEGLQGHGQAGVGGWRDANLPPGGQGSIVDEVEPHIRELLAQFRDLLTTVIAEHISWQKAPAVPPHVQWPAGTSTRRQRAGS